MESAKRLSVTVSAILHCCCSFSCFHCSGEKLAILFDFLAAPLVEWDVPEVIVLHTFMFIR